MVWKRAAALCSRIDFINKTIFGFGTSDFAPVSSAAPLKKFVLIHGSLAVRATGAERLRDWFFIPVFSESQHPSVSRSADSSPLWKRAACRWPAALPHRKKHSLFIWNPKFCAEASALEFHLCEFLFHVKTKRIFQFVDSQKNLQIVIKQ